MQTLNLHSVHIAKLRWLQCVIQRVHKKQEEKKQTNRVTTKARLRYINPNKKKQKKALTNKISNKNHQGSIRTPAPADNKGRLKTHK